MARRLFGRNQPANNYRAKVAALLRARDYGRIDAVGGGFYMDDSALLADRIDKGEDVALSIHDLPRGPERDDFVTRTYYSTSPLSRRVWLNRDGSLSPVTPRDGEPLTRD